MSSVTPRLAVRVLWHLAPSVMKRRCPVCVQTKPRVHIPKSLRNQWLTRSADDLTKRAWNLACLRAFEDLHVSESAWDFSYRETHFLVCAR